MRRLKTLNISLAAATAAGTYSYTFTSDKDMAYISAIAVAENKRNTADIYRIGLKPTNGGDVVIDVCNRAFWVVDAATPINERMLYLGEGGIIAQGYQYTVSVTIVENLVGALNLDMVFDQRN
ncbi:MAG: hypothetical protein ACO1PI_04590 [Bacteroidota bacterium]